MDLSADRLKPTSRTQERPLSTSAEERKRRPPHRRSSDEVWRPSRRIWRRRRIVISWTISPRRCKSTSNSTAITSSLRSRSIMNCAIGDVERVAYDCNALLERRRGREPDGNEPEDRMTANNLMSLANQVGNLPSTPEEQQRRDKLLAELSQQRSFCRSMLRRWRRSLLLQRQLLDYRANLTPTASR